MKEGAANDGADGAEEEDGPKSEQEFVKLKMDYKATKRQLKEMRRAIPNPTEDEQFNMEVARLEKH